MPVLLLLFLSACGGQPAVPGGFGPPGGGGDSEHRVTGSERLAWNQEANSAAELRRYSYVAYVDGQRTPLVGASCASVSTAAGYPCRAPLPRLSFGRHVIELATSVTLDGATIESPRSVPLVINMMAASGAAVGAPSSSAQAARRPLGVEYRMDVVASDVTAPVALAFTPDERLMVAERRGRVLIYPKGSSSPHSAWTPAEANEDGAVVVHSVTAHPRFDRNRFILLLYTAVTESAGVMRLLRLREVNNELGEPAVLLDGIPSSSLRPTGVLAFGADGKIYIGSNDADLESSAGDPGELSGKLLRLNDDGSTPSDNPSESPVIGVGLGQPVALGWNPQTGRLWLVDRSAALQREPVTSLRGQIHSLDSAEFLDPSGNSEAVATRFGDGLFSATEGRLNWSRLVSGSVQPGLRYELPSWFGPPQALAQGPDGFLYVASDVGRGRGSPGRDMVVRIVPVSPVDRSMGG